MTSKRVSQRSAAMVLLGLALHTVSLPALPQQPSWATSRASELTEQAEGHLAGGQLALARKRALEALQIDGSYGAAYLLLARMRELDGDTEEALRVYAAGIERVRGFGEAYAARAMLLDKLGRSESAAADMQSALSFSGVSPAVQTLAMQFYVRRKAWVAALQIARARARDLESGADDAALRAARVQVAALAKMAGELDPAVHGADDRVWERRAIGATVRRRGGW